MPNITKFDSAIQHLIGADTEVEDCMRSKAFHVTGLGDL
jgi:hypothetical protein